MDSQKVEKSRGKTGGRKAGVPNKKTAALVADIEKSGLTPLQYMLKVMRDAKADVKRRDAMAAAAAPYVHSKLASIEHSGPGGKPIEHAVTQITRRIVKSA